MGLPAPRSELPNTQGTPARVPGAPGNARLGWQGVSLCTLSPKSLCLCSVSCAGGSHALRDLPVSSQPPPRPLTPGTGHQCNCKPAPGREKGSKRALPGAGHGVEAPRDPAIGDRKLGWCLPLTLPGEGAEHGPALGLSGPRPVGEPGFGSSLPASCCLYTATPGPLEREQAALSPSKLPHHFLAGVGAVSRPVAERCAAAGPGPRSLNACTGIFQKDKATTRTVGLRPGTFYRQADPGLCCFLPSLPWAHAVSSPPFFTPTPCPLDS